MVTQISIACGTGSGGTGRGGGLPSWIPYKTIIRDVARRFLLEKQTRKISCLCIYVSVMGLPPAEQVASP